MRLFLINVPQYSCVSGYSSKRTYVINPKRIRFIDYHKHFNKLDIQYDNGDKFSIKDHPDLENVYSRVTRELSDFCIQEENIA